MGINLKQTESVGVDIRQLPNELKVKICTGLENNTMGLVNVTGNSMEPTIEDRGMVLMDTYDKTIENGYAYVFKIEGGLYKNYDEDTFCKRLSIDENGNLTITSENARWKPFYFDSVDRIEIMGKVVASVAHGSNVLKEVTNKYEVMHSIPIAKNWDDVEKIMKRNKEIDEAQGA